MKSATLPILDATAPDSAADPKLKSAIRADLLAHGAAIVRVTADGPTLAAQQREIAQLRSSLCPGGGTASGSRGMGGIVKKYGAGCMAQAFNLRLHPPIQNAFAALHGCQPSQLAVSCDALSILGSDATRPASRQPVSAQPATKAEYEVATGGSLRAHVDISPLGHSKGRRMEAALAAMGGDTFRYSVQAFYAVEPIPKGGATFVYADGEHAAAQDASHFEPGRDDFTHLSEKGHAAYADRWRAVDGIPGGCLIMWLSRTPHGNKLADAEQPIKTRGGIFVCWMPRHAVTEDEAQRAKKRKFENACQGRTGDHWPLHDTPAHGGSHYSNGQGKTKVLCGKTKGVDLGAPVWNDELRDRILAAL